MSFSRMQFTQFQTEYWFITCSNNLTLKLGKYLATSQPGSGAAREKFDELMSPNWTFYVTQSFLSRDPFGF